MSKLSFLFILTLLTITLQNLLKTKSKCVALDGDCDLTSYCCGKLECKDYRCAKEGTKENQVKWAPKGPKCDFFHHCKKGLYCQSHRCDVKVGSNMTISDIENASNSKEGSLSLIDKLTADREYANILKNTTTVQSLVSS